MVHIAWAARTARRPSTARQRNTVERCINKLKQRRGRATRYNKTATIYLAALHLAAISSGRQGDPEGTAHTRPAIEGIRVGRPYTELGWT
ncbi:transposase [Streptomyces sp. BR123]|nr:transposase [Streptomyces sp. BR123]